MVLLAKYNVLVIRKVMMDFFYAEMSHDFSEDPVITRYTELRVGSQGPAHQGFLEWPVETS